MKAAEKYSHEVLFIIQHLTKRNLDFSVEFCIWPLRGVKRVTEEYDTTNDIRAVYTRENKPRASIRREYSV